MARNLKNSVCVLFLLLFCLLFFENRNCHAQDSFVVIAASAFKYRGKYEYNVAYKVGDIVFENGSSWACIKNNNTNKDPHDSPNYWGELLRAFKHKGDFSRNTQYVSGDIVFENGASWICIKDNNTDHDPHDSPNYWGKLAINGKDGQNGAQGPQGPAGPPVTSVAVCTQGEYCSCSGRTISNVSIGRGGSCSASSDTGKCTAWLDANSSSYRAGCCVCAAE